MILSRLTSIGVEAGANLLSLQNSAVFLPKDAQRCLFHFFFLVLIVFKRRIVLVVLTAFVESYHFKFMFFMLFTSLIITGRVIIPSEIVPFSFPIRYIFLVHLP